MPSNKNTQKNTQVVNVKIVNPEKVKRVYKTRPKKSLMEEELALQALEQSDQVMTHSTSGGPAQPTQIGFAPTINLPSQLQDQPFSTPQILSLANQAIDDRLAKFSATQNFTNIETPTSHLPITNPQIKEILKSGRKVGSKNKPRFITPAEELYTEILKSGGGGAVVGGAEATQPIKTSEFPEVKPKRKYTKDPTKVRKPRTPKISYAGAEPAPTPIIKSEEHEL